MHQEAVQPCKLRRAWRRDQAKQRRAVEGGGADHLAECSLLCCRQGSPFGRCISQYTIDFKIRSQTSDVSSVAVADRGDELGALALDIKIARHSEALPVVVQDQPKQLLGVLSPGFHLRLRLGLPASPSAARPRSTSRRIASGRSGSSSWAARQAS